MDIATIIAAVIAAVAAIYSVRVTKKGNEKNIESTEKISKQVQNAENERTKAQIDANLVWNARIEWIQNVRRVTADFINACFSYSQTDISPPSKEEHLEEKAKLMRESINFVHKSKNLLILYFGPDKPSEGERLATDIYDQETNAGKNEMIVELIEEIYALACYYLIQKSKYYSARDELNQCDRCKTENGPKCQEPEEGDFYTEYDCEMKQKTLHDTLSKTDSEMQNFHDKVSSLSEAMRIYLKIEWNEAKNWDKKDHTSSSHHKEQSA